MAEKKEQDTEVSFKDTLNLPHTDFPMRANAQENDPAMLARWASEDLYTKTFNLNQGNEKYILHDGPPYANGNIHIGHAYNKILKDIVTKSRRMLGMHVPVTPGWDCHGLPIELKVTKEHPGLSRSELKKACRSYAQKWIDIQRDEFKQLGVLMDWQDPYLTMNFDYESSILRAFGNFVAQNYIERKNKTVPWCTSCQTVLATAEIEYEDRKDPSIYVQFPLEESIVNKLFPDVANKEVSMLIWTTTPWTLPLNRAVLVKPNEQYVILDINGKYVIVGAALADKVCTLLTTEKKIIATFNSDALIQLGARVYHPFIKNLLVPIIADQSVELSEGTANVHSAPGAGPIDYEVGVKHNLEIFSPVTPDGKYAHGIAPTELEGMSLQDGQIWVIKKLVELDKLLYKSSVRHSYPHCWRCRGGLIFRATKQWFFDLAKGNVKHKSLDAIAHLNMFPEASRNRLAATVEGRLEWCISRQRVWGVPIPALICNHCDYTYTAQVLIDRVAEEVAKYGIEYWDEVSLKDLLPADFECPMCQYNDWKKETDILDVWFDSGVSHYAVLMQRPELRFPADIYLEGKDQHRGWFQSSLLTSIALEHEACTKAFLTHGFTVDATGRKMSKSLGNVVSPQEIISKLGTDGLRLWAASIDYADDAVVSDVLLRNVQEVLRKVRNTCRFLLSNLYDFDIKTDAIPFENLQAIDQYALRQLTEFNEVVLHAYQTHDFTGVYHQLVDYCTVELSSFYLDIIKDRLYVEQANGHARRSAQTACWYILDTLTKLMAPVLSFTAEQVSDNYEKNKTESIHLQRFADIRPIIEQLGSAEEHEERWDLLKRIRSVILKAIEVQREQGLIKHSLEARVSIHLMLPKEQQQLFDSFTDNLQQQSLQDFFKEFVIVSQFNIVDQDNTLEKSSLPGLLIKVERAYGNKCPRCWNWDTTEYAHYLCERCHRLLNK